MEEGNVSQREEGYGIIKLLHLHYQSKMLLYICPIKNSHLVKQQEKFKELIKSKQQYLSYMAMARISANQITIHKDTNHRHL